MINKVATGAGNIARSVLNSKIIEKGAQNYTNPKFVAGVALSSILLKDAIGCVYYVKQSLSNDKIPEEKRKFVAALDMTNGVLMVLAQFLMFFTLSNDKMQKKVFDKIFAKTFSAQNQEVIFKKAAEVLKKTGVEPDKKLLAKGLEAAKNNGAKSLGALISLVGATIVAKRMIVPFVSTPLAQWAKDNIIDKKGKNSCKTEPIYTDITSRMPSIDKFQQYFKGL